MKYQTTYTFNTKEGAEIFHIWLLKNSGDRDYGYPKHIDSRNGIHTGFVVEYSAETDLARGVATGIEFASLYK